jgi:co-chaperonin GroES (HSP10)
VELERLLDDRVLVRMESPVLQIGHIWVPSTAKREPYELYQAIVLQTGPGRRRLTDGERNAMDVKAGDRVVLYWSAVEMEPESFDGHQRIVSEKMIQCVLEDEADELFMAQYRAGLREMENDERGNDSGSLSAVDRQDDCTAGGSIVGGENER